MSKRVITNPIIRCAPPAVAALLSIVISGCGNVASDESDSAEASVGSTSDALVIGPSGHALNYTRLCGENGACPNIGNGNLVAYGGNGSFIFKSVIGSGSIPCTNAFFGGDPAVGVTKACYFANYSFRANENQSSGTSGPRAIAYGANGAFNVLTINGAYNCNNATFGDPIPGPSKACYEALPDYAFAANENGTISGLSSEPVAYGANGNYVFKVLSGTQGCNNSVFGDPAPGLSKTCYRLLFHSIADEGGSIPQTSDFIYYGSGLNGFYLGGTGSSAHGSCSNAAFGGDPDVGPTKHCFHF